MTWKTMLCTAAFSLALALPLLAATYEFKTINPFNSVETSARGINDAGDVVGDFADAALSAAGSESGFLRHNGKYTKINFPGAVDTDANGINEEGDIVGTYDLVTNNVRSDHGYVLHYGKFKALPDPPNQDGFPDFNAINEEGDIVGVLTPKLVVGGNKGFLLDDGHYTLIDCGHYRTEANGINDDGDIVGECTDVTPVYAEHGFLLRGGKFYLIDAPGAACDGTVATGIGENGTITGTFDDANCNEHGFVLKGFPSNPAWTTVDAPGATDTKLAGTNEYGALAGTATITTNNTSTDKGFKAEKN
jgi:uncharacterized membrane protein